MHEKAPRITDTSYAERAARRSLPRPSLDPMAIIV
jgi:hypothetical protein